MKSFIEMVETSAREAVLKATGIDDDPIVRWSTNPQFGDIQINAAMSLAKKLGKNPRELASEIVANLELGSLSIVPPEIAGPGFINVTISDESFLKYTKTLFENDNCGVSKSKDIENIVIDYGGANIAKEMHIGHLRSSVIGDSIYRVLTFLGHNTIKQDHLGDWGTQFGMLVEFLCENGKVPETLPDLSDLDGFYRQAQQKFKEDQEFATKARSRVALLQSGDKDSLRAWKHIYDETMTHLLEVYKRMSLNLTAQDSRGESFYNQMLEGICEELERKRIATSSEGALVIYTEGVLDREGNPFGLIIRKSDGGYGYATTDLAAIKFAVENDKAEKIVYCVDARQSQHFEIVFDAAKRAGWLENTKPFHAAFGQVLGADGKPFKTRSGDVVKLKDLLDEAISKSKELITSKSPDFDEKELNELARMIGIGAIKYSDLSNNRVKNYVFDWDRMLAMEGNTSPYLQYAIARINSLVAKANTEDLNFSETNFIIGSIFEKTLVKSLSKFGETLHEVAINYEPHRLCTYLFELAQEFSGFYENQPILKEENVTVRKTRLALCVLTARTLKTGLDLLGIDSPERM